MQKRTGFTLRAIWLTINDPNGTDKYRNIEVFNSPPKGVLILLTLDITACSGLAQNPGLQFPSSGPPDHPLIIFNSIFPDGKQCLLTKKREENNHSYRKYLWSTHQSVNNSIKLIWCLLGPVYHLQDLFVSKILCHGLREDSDILFKRQPTPKFPFYSPTT